MAEDAAFDDYPAPARAENKRKLEESEDQEKKAGFSASPGERVRKTGFSGPPAEHQHERKTGFSAPTSDQYERKTGFSGPAPEQYERKSGFSNPNEPERKTGFSGPAGGDFERKTGFSGPPSGDPDRKTGFSGPPSNDFERKTGFSSPPREYERKTGFSGPAGGDLERKTGFSGPPGDSHERKTGFSGPPSDSRAAFSNAPSSGLSSLEIAKQRAEQIVARLVAQDNKRPRTDEGADDQFAGKFDSGSAGYAHEDHDRGQMFQDHTQVHHNEDQSGGFYNTQGQFNLKRVDIPNGRVGVVIGKSGETIKGLQARSGARIQITRDADHDPQALNRQVEIMGTPDQISRAEQMIKDVIAEAEAGGPGPFLSSGFGGSGSFGEPIQIRVPTSKVGLIIGRGGETIKSMQNQSGARIQLVPVAMPDYSQERVITLVGTKQQTDMASDLIKEVIDENRPRGPPGGYNQQGFRPPGPPQWSQPRPPMQSQGYGYQQQGSFPGQPQQQPYGGYAQPPPAGTPQQYPPQSQQYGQQPSARPPQQFPGQPQSYGYPQQSSAGSSQEFPGQSQQYGGFVQRAPAGGQQQQTASQGFFNPSNQPGTSPTDSNSGYSQPQAPYSQQSPYGQQGYGQQGSVVQSPGQSAPTPQPYGQTYSQQQTYGQTPSGQPGYGQQSVPSSGYLQQSYGPQGTSQSSEQNPSALPGYALPGSLQQAHLQQGSAQSSYGQQPSNQPLGYGQHVPSFTQQEGIPSAYGQGGPFQPGYSAQGASQQDASIQPSYGQKEVPQVGYGTAGAAQTGYASGAAQPGYGQAGPGFSTQGPSQSNYGQQGTLQPGYGQQGPYGPQASSAPVYGTPQQGTPSVMYGAQGSMQSGYSAQGSVAAQPSYIQAGASQQSYGQQGTAISYSHGGLQANPSYTEGATFDHQSQQGSQGAYAQQIHGTSGDPSGNASNGGFDPANASTGPGGAQSAQS